LRSENLLDPDPVAVATLVISTIATVATVAGTFLQIRNTQEKKITAARQRIHLALLDLEARFLDLKASYE